MTADRYIDLDAAFGVTDTPLIVRMFGQDWSLPGTPPAELTLAAAELTKATKGGEIPAWDAIAFASSVVPKPILRAWCDRGLTTTQLVHVLNWLLDEYKAGMQQQRPTLRSVTSAEDLVDDDEVTR